MNAAILKISALTAAMFVTAGHVSAQFPEGPEGFALIGKLATRNAIDIPGSTWSIGGETIDRNYTDYHSYKKYLGPLGAKRIRLQGGWARCEKQKGVHDFNWLDSIVNDAVSQGVKPWIGLSYGNPIYEGGGEPKLAGNFPSSPEALQAWDNWVKATISRYKNKVYDWEIWNEPDIIPKVTGEKYAQFFIRTVDLVKEIQPQSRVYAFGLASVGKRDFPDQFFATLKAQNKLHLVDVVTFHGYTMNPDDAYPVIKKLEELVRSYVPDVEMMQGENGCPSTPKSNSVGALSNNDWTELTQSKWDLRRMLGDFGRGYATNVFTISDFRYVQGDHMTGYNSKGLLIAFPDKTIDRPKMAYYAVQRTMNLFDSKIENVNKGATSLFQDSLSVFLFRNQVSKTSLFTVWYNGDKPVESFKPLLSDFKIKGDFNDPVYVDLVSGSIYRIPKTQWKKNRSEYEFSNIPVPDYPVVIADLKSIPFIRITN